MRRRTRTLKQTAIESLTLAVEVFNRPSSTGRTQGVLLNLQHAFEMVFKAVIWQKRGRIQPRRLGKAYSFKECLGIVRAMGLMNESEAVVAATIDAHRDGVQHQGAAVTEERLYVDTASGVRLFDDLIQRVFGERLADHSAFAKRMLPVAANPPRELHILTTNDVEYVRGLLAPRRRQRTEALAFLRTLVLSERAASDPMAEVEQPTDYELGKLARQVQATRDWAKLLPGLARLTLEPDEGVTYKVRIVKRGDVPGVRIVKPGEKGSDEAVALLKYNEINQYPFGLKALAKQTGINEYEARAVVHLLGLQRREEMFKHIVVDKVRFKHYSQAALREVRAAVAAGRVDAAKTALREHERSKRRAA